MDLDKTQPEQNANKMRNGRRLTPADTLLLRALIYKQSYFARKGMLAVDGSFFYDDARLAKENGLCSKTVKRSKKRLEAMGKIKCLPGKYRGVATKFWIFEKEPYQSPFFLEEERDRMSQKEGHAVPKVGPGVPPNNLIIKKIESFSKKKMTDDQERERHDAFQECIRGLKRKQGSVK